MKRREIENFYLTSFGGRAVDPNSIDSLRFVEFLVGLESILGFPVPIELVDRERFADLDLALDVLMSLQNLGDASC